jgi:prepilin-type N-terminal cleavage/methylation domain-containing protein
MHTITAIRKRAAAAFTLIETLVVVSILAILISLVVSIANAVRVTGIEQQVRADLNILMAQVHAYRDLTGKYPAHWAGANPDPTFTAKMNFGVLICGAGGLVTAGNSSGGLMAIPSIAGELNERFPSRRFVDFKDGTTTYRYLSDGFPDNMPLNYLSNGGLGGMPVIISTGPDRQWGTADDIRSDSQ